MASPASLPAGWAAYSDPEGRTYYANAATGETSWEPPAAPPAPTLPEGWAAYQDPEGRTYYANAATGETSWEPPGVAPAAAAPVVAETPTAVAPAVADTGYAVTAGAGGWSTDYAYAMGQRGEEHWFEGKAFLLDLATWTSVAAAIDALNAGTLVVEAGYCIIFSNSRQLYYLLWRQDKETEAWKALGLDDKTSYWHTGQCCSVGATVTEAKLVTRIQLLDKTYYNSVTTVVDTLNAGTIAVEIGYCAIFSESQQQYFLLWREDKEAEAMAQLDALLRDP